MQSVNRRNPYPAIMKAMLPVSGYRGAIYFKEVIAKYSAFSPIL